jgi:hypothetical protein
MSIDIFEYDIDYAEPTDEELDELVRGIPYAEESEEDFRAIDEMFHPLTQSYDCGHRLALRTLLLFVEQVAYKQVKRSGQTLARSSASEPDRELAQYDRNIADAISNVLMLCD